MVSMDAVTRRRFLRDAAVAGSGAAVAATVPTAAWAAANRRGKRVAILGGGMAGLAAAHEVVDRGFQVTVYEPTALGGKARSIGAPGTGKGGRKDLPGEHGFRFFPGFYHAVPDTMRRIPFAGQANGVWDNLVPGERFKFYRSGNRPDAAAAGLFFDPDELQTPDGIQRVLTELTSGVGVSIEETLYFVNRVLVFLTSSDQRREGQFENLSWWDFMGAARRSPAYQRELVATLTRSLVAAKEKTASTRTIGRMGEAFINNAAGLGNDGALDRILDLPTNEAWIDPWVAHLKSLGVTFVLGRAVTGFDVAGGQISGARTIDRLGRRATVDADWYILAAPVDKAVGVLGRNVRALDPSLNGLDQLVVDWMVGIQFFLKTRINLARGHLTFIDAPWALTALTQAQFWQDRQFSRDYGDGTVNDCLSVDISDWDAPGILYGKPAKKCTPEQVAKEVWAQIKMHHTPAAQLPDSILHSWFLDPGIQWNSAKGENSNDTPLLVNTAGSWKNRPKAVTKVPNLFLAGDYLQTNIDLATMEGANEGGRAAAAGILAASGSNQAPPQTWKLYQSPDLAGWRDFDAWRYSMGMPNLFDSP